MTPSTLTAGPRGRHLLLGLASRYDDDVRAAAHDLALAYDLVHTPGTFAFGWQEGEPVDQVQIDADLRARVPALAEFAAMLTRVEFPAPGPRPAEFTQVMTNSVAEAAYWQAPRGAEVLARAPELDSALRVLARRVAPAAPGWWSESAPRQQYALAFHGAALGESVPIEKWLTDTVAQEERARREYPPDPEANYSGEWWSTPAGISSTRAIDGVPVGLDWTEDISAGAQVARAARVEVSGARILEITDVSTWNTLCWNHPLEVTHSRRHDWYRVSGRDGRWVIPDWAALAHRYDAVHLTARAYLAGATKALTVDAGIGTMIAGWGPDETRWLRAVPLGETVTWDLQEHRGEYTWRPRP